MAIMLTMLGVAVGYLLSAADPVWYSSFVPAELAGGRDFNASAEQLRKTLYDSGSTPMLATFATSLFTHNSQVAILCFALGFAFGVPTVLLLIYTGAMLGAMMALFAKHGLAMELGGWLIIHGSTEIFAIILAGAAGLKIGWSVVFPGDRSRLWSAAESGKSAGIAMAGVIIMLLVAGLLEGFGRQLILTDAVRYAIGLGLLLFWIAFFYSPRRGRLG